MINLIRKLNKMKKNSKSKKKNNIKENNSNPKDIRFSKVISNNLYMEYVLDNAFSVFKSINGILYIIFGNKNKSIIFYNFNNEQIISEIKNAHKEYISNIRYYLNKITIKEFIISISSEDNNIKLWDLETLQCFLNLEKVYLCKSLFSAIYFYFNHKNYIITINTYQNSSALLFDFKGKEIKKIEDFNERTNVIDSYYDNKLGKAYLITGHNGYVKSYNFNENKLYYKYCDEYNDFTNHFSIIINDNNNLVKIIESSFEGIIRIWDFHSGKLIKKINVIDKLIYGICLWNENFLFVGCIDKNIKLVDLNKGIVVKNLSGHNQEICTIKKIIHPKYGECLLSHGINDIILWTNKDK